MNPRVLIVGAGGAIGSHMVSHFLSLNYDVDGTSRSGSVGVPLDPMSQGFREVVASLPIYQAVVFAQGLNASDSLSNYDPALQRDLLEANVVFPSQVLAELLDLNRLAPGCRICIISSTWADLARQDRLSYSTSKAAVSGFVRASSVDLAASNMLVNAVLPGPLDTPMTRKMLSDEQLVSLTSLTPHRRLVSLETLSSLVAWLVGPTNLDVTGECIHVDLGLSNARLV